MSKKNSAPIVLICLAALLIIGACIGLDVEPSEQERYYYCMEYHDITNPNEKADMTNCNQVRKNF
jgi:hypothetical protein